MVDGVTSLSGQNAPKLVVEGHKRGLVHVPTPNQITVGRTALALLRNLESVTKIHVQVRGRTVV